MTKKVSPKKEERKVSPKKDNKDDKAIQKPNKKVDAKKDEKVKFSDSYMTWLWGICPKPLLDAWRLAQESNICPVLARASYPHVCGHNFS